MEVSCELHAQAVVPPGNNIRYRSTRWLGGPESGSGRSGEEKNSFQVRGFEPRTIQHVAYF